MPAFAIITPTYQCREFLPRCYWSLCQQTVTDWEWIIVDDASTDGTALQVDGFNDPRIVFLRMEKNIGRGMARMRALQIARSDWCVLLDADDFMFPDRLEQAQLAKASGYDFMCSPLLLIDNQYKINGVRAFRNNKYPRAFTHASLCGNTRLIREIGYPDYPRAQDVRIVFTLANNYNGKFSPDPLYIYHETANAGVRDAILGQFYYLKEMGYLTANGVLKDCMTIRLIRLRRVIKIFGLFPFLASEKMYRMTIKYRKNLSTGVTGREDAIRVEFIKNASNLFPALRRSAVDKP